MVNLLTVTKLTFGTKETACEQDSVGAVHRVEKISVTFSSFTLFE